MPYKVVAAALLAALACLAPRARAQQAAPGPAGAARTHYEQRWDRACRERAAVGHLDPPPGRRFTLVVAPDAATGAPRLEHAHLAADSVSRLKAALLPQDAAFRACFAAIDYEAWVELALGRSQPPAATAELPAEAVACASELLRQALARADAGDAQFAAVRYEHPDGPPPSEQGGGLSKAHIRDVIQARIGEVRTCYEQAIRVWPKLSGRVDTRFVIGPDGAVLWVEVTRSSAGKPALECCITSAVKGWRFDAPADGGNVVVRYPFILRQVQSL